MIKIERPPYIVIDDPWDEEGAPTPEAVEALAKLIEMARVSRLKSNPPTEEKSHE